jgi:hypothetical protein
MRYYIANWLQAHIKSANMNSYLEDHFKNIIIFKIENLLSGIYIPPSGCGIKVATGLVPV